METFEIKQRFPFLIHPPRLARWLSYQYQFPGTAWRIQSVAKGRVLAGPFKGVRIPAWQHRSYSELLGVFEHDLVSLVEDVIARKRATIINVGAAYGYYVLGFAHRLRDTRIIAYESDVTRLNLIRKYSALNGVADRIAFRGECTASMLAHDLDEVGQVFVLMDIEGGEGAVLQDGIVPQLQHAEMLVELHEVFVPGITEILQERFAPTHCTSLIRETPVPLQALDLSAWTSIAARWPRSSMISGDLRWVGCIYGLGHERVTRYGALIAWAREMGRNDFADILEEKKAADGKLTSIAEGRVNAKAGKNTAAGGTRRSSGGQGSCLRLVGTKRCRSVSP